MESAGGLSAHIRGRYRRAWGHAWSGPVNDPAVWAVLVLLCLGLSVVAGLADRALLIVAIPLAVGWYAFALRRPVSATLGLIAFDSTVAQLLKIYRPGSTVVTALSDVLAAILLIALAVIYGRPRIASFLDVMVAAFVGLVAVMALLNPVAPHGTQLAAGVRTLALYPLFYFYGGAILNGAPIKRFYTLCGVLAILLGAVSIAEAIMGPAWSVNHHLLAHVVRDWTTAGGSLRPSSLLPLPGVAGVIFGALTLILMTPFAVPYQESPISRRLAGVGLTAAAIGLILSGQRAATLGVVVGLTAVLIYRRSRRLTGAVMVILSVGVLAAAISPSVLSTQRVTDVTASRSSSSVQIRYSNWTEVVRQLPTYPLGHGPGYTGSAATRFGGGTSSVNNATTDNYWMKMSWELGIPGVIWYTAFIVVAAVAAVTRLRRQSSRQGETCIYFAILGLVFQQAVVAGFSNVLDPLPYALLFWVILGCVRPQTSADASLR
jgi:hypothetical protein